MTLLERTTSLRNRCTKLESLNTRIEEVTALSTRLIELNKAGSSIPACLATLRLLRDANIVLDDVPNELQRAQSALAKIQSRFAQDRTVVALTRGQDWNVLLRELPATVRALAAVATQAWKRSVERMFAGDPPLVVEGRLARTDRNQDTLKRYRQAYDAFSKAGAALPNNIDDVEAVQKAAKTLASVAKEFDFDVPDAVKKFLDALPQGGAPLGLLTDEVQAWIAGQGQTNRYRIIAGGE